MVIACTELARTKPRDSAARLVQNDTQKVMILMIVIRSTGAWLGHTLPGISEAFAAAASPGFTPRIIQP